LELLVILRTRMTSLEFCPNDEHDFGDSYITIAKSGPMEGEWIVTPCRRCDAFTMGAKEGREDAVVLLQAALENLGLKPTARQIGPGPRNTTVVIVEGLPLPPPAVS
jgi:hypothetical protein